MSKENFIFGEIKRGETIIDNLFNKFIQNDGFLCGGFARYCCTNVDNPVVAGDIDIYCKNEDSYENIKYRLEAEGYIQQKESEVANSMIYPFTGFMPLQLIKPLDEGHVKTFSEDIYTVLDNFDFSIIRCGIYYDIYTKEYVVVKDIDFDNDEKEKKLNIKNIHCPIAEVYRVMKYTKKGYFLSTLETIKIFEDWVERTDDYKSNLIEKLKIDDPSQEDIDEMEKLLHID